MKEPRNIYCFVVRYDKFKAFFIRVCAYNLGQGYEKMIKELFHNNRIDNINYIDSLACPNSLLRDNENKTE